MDPDPRYWDEEFAKTTKFGEIITPPIYCTYLKKTPSQPESPTGPAIVLDLPTLGPRSADNFLLKKSNKTRGAHYRPRDTAAKFTR